MPKLRSYIATQIKEVHFDAVNAAEARQIAESLFYVRPGFDKNLHRTIRETSLIVNEKRN